MTSSISARLARACVLCLLLSASAYAQNVRFRMLAVPAEEDATLLLEQLAGGIPFDELAREFSLDETTRAQGGMMGPIATADLRPEFRTGLAGLAPGETSRPVAVDNAWVLFHAIDPREEQWMQQRTAGLDAFDREDYAEAEDRLVESVAAAERLGPADLRLAQSLTALAGFYQSQSRFPESLALLERVLDVQTTAVGEDHRFTGETLNNIAEIDQLLGNFNDAERFYLRALANLQRSLGQDHPNVAVVLDNLANLYQDQGQYARAQPLFLQSLGIMEGVVGAEDPSLATTIADLGRSYHGQANYTQAARQYRRALALIEPVLGTSDPNVQEMRRYLNAASRQQPLPEQAEALQNIVPQ